jgi:hypothetical protein
MHTLGQQGCPTLPQVCQQSDTQHQQQSITRHTRRHKTIICPRHTTAGPAALRCSASDNSRGAIINMHETACCSTLLCAHGEALVHASWVCSIGRSLTAHASHPAAQHEQAAEHSARSQPLCKRQAGRYLRCLFSQVAQSSPSLP